MFRLIVLALVVAALAGGAYLLGRPAGSDTIRASISAAEALGGDTAGYARATEPRPFVFPADHGPHPTFRNEWWYYTGNLETAEGRHFGFQLTFFRTALSPQPEQRASDWATNQVYMAHLALTDAGAERFYSFERFSRAALGLAGAQAQPFRVWLEDWEARGPDPNGFPMRLHAAAGSIALDLTLQPGKQPVLQGDRGLSRKGPEPGNASLYYSLTRMPSRGSIRVGDQVYQVRGLSWMDREWSTSALGEELLGWDWFALQLQDGREIMFYQLRRRDGQVDPFSSGTLVAADGSSTPLTPADVQLEVLDYWHSPRDATRYPARWRLSVPSQQLTLYIEPYLADQELQVSVRYWEGAVRVLGERGEPLGNGYVELVGYNEQ